MKHTQPQRTYAVLRATREHAADLLKLRLEAVTQHPIAFTSDPEHDAQVDWVARIEDPNGAIFVALDSDEMIGMTGIYRGNSSKVRHAAVIWGVYVNEAYRRAGVAKKLFDAVLAWARTNEIIIVRLGVAVANIPAYTFYKNYGFVEYGRETKSVLVDGVLYDEYLMAMEIV